MVWCGKTEIVRLPDGEIILKISLFISREYTRIQECDTDRQTDGRTPRDDIGRAYAKHCAAKCDDYITVNDSCV